MRNPFTDPYVIARANRALILFFNSLSNRTRGQRPYERPVDDKDLDHREVFFIQHTALCPYCLSKLYRGPAGGMTINASCSDTSRCNARFNVSITPGFHVGQFFSQPSTPRNHISAP